MALSFGALSELAISEIDESGGVIAAPFIQNDWPNPVLKSAAIVVIGAAVLGSPLALLVTPPAVPAPFVQSQWLNPGRAAPNLTAQTSQKLGTPFGYLSPDAPFAQRDWPNPVLAPYGFQRATSQPLGRLTALLPVFVQSPLNQYDWPNPTLRLKRFDTQPLGSPLKLTTLANADRIGPRQLDWPNPVRALKRFDTQPLGVPVAFIPAVIPPTPPQTLSGYTVQNYIVRCNGVLIRSVSSQTSRERSLSAPRTRTVSSAPPKPRRLQS